MLMFGLANGAVAVPITLAYNTLVDASALGGASSTPLKANITFDPSLVMAGGGGSLLFSVADINIQIGTDVLTPSSVDPIVFTDDNLTSGSNT